MNSILFLFLILLTIFAILAYRITYSRFVNLKYNDLNLGISFILIFLAITNQSIEKKK